MNHAYTEEERKRLERYHPGCLKGEHVPVAAHDRHLRILDVYCQNCLIPMTKEQHRAFFAGKGRSDIARLDYFTPGDPRDVDTFTST